MGLASRFVATAFLTLITSLVVGCSQQDKPVEPDPSNRVSTIPWNRPQSWEGQGMMPGFQGSY